MIEFTSIGQMLRDTEQAGLPLWENVLLSDCERQGISREESLARMTAMLEVMVQADQSYRPGTARPAVWWGATEARWPPTPRRATPCAVLSCPT